jgi:hypothetical protein
MYIDVAVYLLSKLVKFRTHVWIAIKCHAPMHVQNFDKL